MNIQKINRLGIAIAAHGFIGTHKRIEKLRYKQDPQTDNISINSNLLRYDPHAKIIRVSKGIMDACRLIDFESIKENIDSTIFDFKSMFILLDNDDSGLIKVERAGSDFGFVMFNKLNSFNNDFEFCYNSYSFLNKSFLIEKEICLVKKDNGRQEKVSDFEKSKFVVQLLTYLIFGDITEVFLKPKMHHTNNFTRIINNTKLNIMFCDTLWKQRINVSGFKVRGHFRLQPIGEGRKGRKLIWIEDFEKHGYNRKATVELTS
jgi:hypothetical protein